MDTEPSPNPITFDDFIKSHMQEKQVCYLSCTVRLVEGALVVDDFQLIPRDTYGE